MRCFLFTSWDLLSMYNLTQLVLRSLISFSLVFFSLYVFIVRLHLQIFLYLLHAFIFTVQVYHSLDNDEVRSKHRVLLLIFIVKKSYFNYLLETLLTAPPWAKRSSCSTHGFFLTARPWAERGSWFTRGFFFRRFVCNQTQASTRPNFESRNLWCLLAKSCWNINKSHLRYWLSREKN